MSHTSHSTIRGYRAKRRDRLADGLARHIRHHFFKRRTLISLAALAYFAVLLFRFAHS